MEDQNEQKEKARRFIKSRYPNANLKNLTIGYSSKKNPLMLVVKGPRGGETPIFLNDGSDFQQSFLNQTYVKNALGKPGESLIKQTSDDIRKMQKKRDELHQDEKRYREQKEAKEKEELDLKRRIQSEEEKKQQLQDDPDADKKGLEQKENLIKNLKKNFKTKQKENERLQKNYEDGQKKTQKIGQLQASILQEEQTRDSLERRFNSTRSFDALKEQERNFLRLNEEDQAIIDDDDAAELEKEAAEERVAARNEELARLQTQIAEREAAMPLRERIKENLQKTRRYSDGHPSCGARYDWGGCRLDNQSFEGGRKSDGRRPQRNRSEAWLSAARAYWPDRTLRFQHRCQSRRLPRQTHLAFDFGGSCLSF